MFFSFMVTYYLFIIVTSYSFVNRDQFLNKEKAADIHSETPRPDFYFRTVSTAVLSLSAYPAQSGTLLESEVIESSNQNTEP